MANAPGSKRVDAKVSRASQWCGCKAAQFLPALALLSITTILGKAGFYFVRNTPYSKLVNFGR